MVVKDKDFISGDILGVKEWTVDELKLGVPQVIPLESPTKDAKATPVSFGTIQLEINLVKCTILFFLFLFFCSLNGSKEKI